MTIHTLEHCTIEESENKIVLVYKNILIRLTDWTLLEPERGIAGTNVHGSFRKITDIDDEMSSFVNVGVVPHATEVTR